MTHKFLQRCCGVFVALLLTHSAEAALSIKITQGVEGAVPIAVVPFGWSGSQPDAPIDAAAVIVNDLERSGRFAPLPRADLPAEPHDRSREVQRLARSWDREFGDWQAGFRAGRRLRIAVSPL